MNLLDKILLNVYKRMQKNYLLEQESAKRSKCKCDRTTVLYDSAQILNSRSRGSIKIGRNSHIRGELRVFGKNGRIELGDDCFLGSNSYIWSTKGIHIGDRVLISHNCNIFDNDTHPKNSKKRHEQFKAIVSKGQPRAVDLKEQEVVIEDDVLICANCIILKGCRIGKGSIVGAGTIVNRDIPENSVAFGKPLIIKKNDAEF